jgi:nicotinate-nucleotide adenylyltransferase
VAQDKNVTERRSRSFDFGALVGAARATAPLRGEALAPGMRVGLFGGSFDPPHSGHAHLAQTAMRRLDLDRIWWLVSPKNPLKARNPADLDNRVKAVRTLAPGPGMVVSDLEARLGSQRTIDVVEALQTRHPDVHFVWLMGADNLGHFHRWARWRDLFNRVPVAVMARPDDPLRARLAPATRLFARSRLRESQCRNLPLKPAPAWTYLTEPLDCSSSTALRARN